MSLKPDVAGKMLVIMSGICHGIAVAYAASGVPTPTPDLTSMKGVSYANNESRLLAKATITACSYIRTATSSGVNLDGVQKLGVFSHWHDQFDAFHSGNGPKPDMDAYVSAMVGEVVVDAQVVAGAAQEDLVAA
jgi:hypothetical protein